jgi:tetratricopeptide (TPR) repeat protein
VLIAALCFTGFAAADTVILTGDSAQARLTGEILEYTGAELRLRQAGGRESVVPAERVARIEAVWTPEHQQGDALLAEGKFAEAVAQYGLALRAEKRQWAQRLILSRAVRCYAGLGQFEQAGKTFLIILAYDPATQYFDAVPLSWSSHQPSAALEAQASAWLEAASQPAAVLLGASWLLSTGKRGAAVAALKRLSTEAEPRVAALAKAQLWRTELVTATAEDLAGWHVAIERMPAALRAGPYLTLGRALARLGDGEQAALVLMRVPILYADDRALAAEALVAAADELNKLGRRGEALGLYREAASAHAGTPAAAEAQARLSEPGAK